ncbi:hypothetical protein SEVIR_5G008900v4 [Setaria viridis]|uniref:DUF3741 domain-containing protein n=1 Tax=Setaria viridis TaxID=4556 RepID=A0A4U6UB91_SETVI|nr:uncharacterized protein LOC117857120 [Setaria viridis]XP_034595507.1 uncharacterized protein LOC117857120 [Setaria viridis]XP_034595508.1 uncharacterized protein LOC117857120 [Setaria viridis]TKW12004.1 hypothetical protein SEVIR_5G008900v2 [Setaria viridis]TKW12005.1 hypothetical protein SEVIR_5G008900v2 [Setaria viridis]TKW12006.1 hypothetical protein SEVIR_5G008900v2 [Setaria viridis]TKW12007.1 hypothetical protein SEVIR_5G008900v2 [Setaria viridis]
MHQDSFRSVVCRSLSKNLPPRSKDGSYPETVQCAVPCVVTLQPSVCRNCQGQERSTSQSYREERSMSFNGDYLMAPSLSKHFAEDLLRGAMDLQESLAMLEKFQTASQSMRLSNKKRRPKTGEKSPEIDTIIREVLLRPSNAKKALPRTVNNGLHGQLSNSTDELKNAVKDSFYRKNLLSVSSNNEQASLSQSARYLPNNYLISKISQQKKVAPRSLPSCAAVQPGKSKAPSLVAKLMGLDGLPSQKDNSKMKDEKIKTVSSPRARFDIEMPKSQRLQTQLFGEESGFDAEMPSSEKLAPEHYNVRTDYTSSQKGITPSNNTVATNEIRPMKSSLREINIEQARPKSPKEIKIAAPTSRKQQIKETTEINRRTREKQKSNLTSRNRGGREDAKAKAVSASRTAKVAKNPDRKSVSSSSRSCDSVKPVLQRRTHNNSRQKTVSRRNVKSSTIDELVAYEIQREIFHALDQIDGPSTEHSATPSDESYPNADWEAESSVDDIQKDFCESDEASLFTSHAERTGSTDGDAIHPSSTDIITHIKEAEIKDEIILLLLSDKSFLGKASKLIGIDVYEHLRNQYDVISKVEMKEHKIYLDTAAEQLERKHHQQNSLCYTGFQGQKCRARAYFSLEELLRDISNGIRKLNGYSARDDAGCTKDSLDLKLERDLRCSGASINGVWDMGWQDLICTEETECFIRDAGEDILSLLIEEAALDMCMH